MAAAVGDQTQPVFQGDAFDRGLPPVEVRAVAGRVVRVAVRVSGEDGEAGILCRGQTACGQQQRNDERAFQQEGFLPGVQLAAPYATESVWMQAFRETLPDRGTHADKLMKRFLHARDNCTT